MPIYNSIYNIIEQYIFGTLTPNTPQELATILLSLTGCIFVFSIPFVLVWRVIRLLGGN